MKKPTYSEIAKSKSLFLEYMYGNWEKELSDEEFDSLTFQEKIDLQIETWGPEILDEDE